MLVAPGGAPTYPTLSCILTLGSYSGRPPLSVQLAWAKAQNRPADRDCVHRCCIFEGMFTVPSAFWLHVRDGRGPPLELFAGCWRGQASACGGTLGSHAFGAVDLGPHRPRCRGLVGTHVAWTTGDKPILTGGHYHSQRLRSYHCFPWSFWFKALSNENA